MTAKLRWIRIAAFAALLAPAGYGALSISNNAQLPDATAGQPYRVVLAATGGALPYTWTSPALPAGLALDAATGILSGTPAAQGSYVFTIRVTDSSQASAFQNFNLTVKPPLLTITTVPPLFTGTVGTPYTQTFSASGGTPPYQWATTSGETGALTMNPATGTLAGTPLAAGTLTFTVQVTDSAGATASQSFSIVINPAALAISSLSPLSGTAGTPFSATFTATGGTQPYTWAVTAGAISGLTLNSATGTLSGTPDAAGSFTVTIQATDAAGLTGNRSFTITIARGVLRISTPTQFPAGTVGTAFSQQMAALGGSPPYTWSANGLPDGLTIDPSSGLISGTPAKAGTFSFAVVVTDSARATAADLFHLTVSAPNLPGVTIAGVPATVAPASQPGEIGVSLDAPYAVDLSGQLLLSFAPDAGAGDPAIQFSTGGQSVDFSIPAGSTSATLPANLAFQSGTVAGTITLSVKLQAFGADVTPSPAPAQTVRVERAAPVISSARIVRNSSGFSIEVVGFSTTKEVTQAEFKFSVTGSNTLQTPDVTVAVDSLFSQWYQSAASGQYGSQFTLTQPFTVQGDAGAVVPQSVTLTNRVGSTTASVSQ